MRPPGSSYCCRQSRSIRRQRLPGGAASECPRVGRGRERLLIAAVGQFADEGFLRLCLASPWPDQGLYQISVAKRWLNAATEAGRTHQLIQQLLPFSRMQVAGADPLRCFITVSPGGRRKAKGGRAASTARATARASVGLVGEILVECVVGQSPRGLTISIPADYLLPLRDCVTYCRVLRQLQPARAGVG